MKTGQAPPSPAKSRDSTPAACPGFLIRAGGRRRQTRGLRQALGEQRFPGVNRLWVQAQRRPGARCGAGGPRGPSCWRALRSVPSAAAREPATDLRGLAASLGLCFERLIVPVLPPRPRRPAPKAQLSRA